MDASESQKKLNYLHNLVVIANSDGGICKRELSFLHQEAIRLGIPADYVDYITSVGYATFFNVPDSITERVEYLEKCVEMALIDGKLYSLELDMCRKVCGMLNLQRTILDEILSFHQISKAS